MDRAYRYGQTRDVSVYRLLGAGSIEELIYARQVYKQQQMLIGYEGSMQTRYFAGVSGDKQRQGELFGLKNIFTLHENESTTRMAIERASVGNLDWALENLGDAHPGSAADNSNFARYHCRTNGYCCCCARCSTRRTMFQSFDRPCHVAATRGFQL